MSDTKNVKLGICKVFFGGVDLGYTQGGVDVEVKTDTHVVNVDQFGKSPVNEIIMGRSVSVKVPMAETTLDNLVRIMPGATIVETGATKASGTVTFTGPLTANDTIVLNGVTLTASAGPSYTAFQIPIGSTANDQAVKFAAVVNALEDSNANVVAVAASAVVTLTAPLFETASTSFNGYTLTKTATAVTLSGATLSGGVLATKSKVVVPTAIGTSLLNIAQKLVLHPQINTDTNLADDFVIPLAATAGALQFAYQVEKERIYNVSFMGYPDPVTSTLFIVGDPSAS